MTVKLSGAFFGILFAPAAALAWSSASWTADGAGNWSGDVTNTVHWGGGEVPGSSGTAATKMSFAGGVGDYTVTFPSGAFANAAGVLSASVASGETLTFDGRGCNWALPTLAHDSIVFKTSGDAELLCIGQIAAASDRNFVLNNFLAKHSINAAGKPGSWLDLSADTFTLAPAGRGLYFFGASASKWGDSSGYATLRFSNTTFSVAPQLNIGAFCQATNRLIYSNCRGTLFNGLRFITSYAPAAAVDRVGLFEMHVTDGSSVTSSHDVPYTPMNYMGSTNKTFRVRVDGGSAFNLRSYAMNNPGRHELLVSGAGSSTSPNNSSSIANGGSVTGIVEIADGAVYSNLYALALGPSSSANFASGWAEMTVDGGRVHNTEGAATINHGRMTLKNGAVWQFNRQGRICGAGLAGATEELVLDGATIRGGSPSYAVPIMLEKLTAAKIGPRGFAFEVVTSHAVRFNQHFEDLDLQHGGELLYLYPGTQSSIRNSALLVLSGDAGSKASTESYLTIANCTAMLEEGCNHYSYLTVTNGASFTLKNQTLGDATTAKGATSMRLKGLRLGNATTRGYLSLKPDDLVTVDNDSLELENAGISFSSTLGLGEHTVFRLTQEPTTETQVYWETVAKTVVSSGLDKTKYNQFIVEKGADGWDFKIVVLAEQPAKTGEGVWAGPGSTWDKDAAWTGDGAPAVTNGATFAGAEPKAITVSGEQTAAALTFSADGYTLSGGRVTLADTSGIALNATGSATINSDLHLLAQLPVDVAAGKTVTIAGQILGGGIAKSGEGTLRLTNGGNMMPSSVSVAAGTLEIDPLAAIGFYSDTVRGVLSGGTLKLGGSGVSKAALTLTGRTVIDTPEGVDAELPLPTQTAGGLTKAGAGDLTLSVGQSMTWTVNGSSSVDEGELRIAGNEGTAMNPNQTISIGRTLATSTAETPSQPGLVLSGVKFGTGMTSVEVAYGKVADDDSFLTDPYLVISNGASLTVRDFYVCRNAADPALTFRVLMDRGSICTLLAHFQPNNGSSTVAATNYYTLRNGSKIACSSYVECCAPFEMDLDASEFCGGSLSSPGTFLMTLGGGHTKFNCTINLRNGSVLRCSEICYGTGAKRHEGSYGNPWRLNFTDSEWDLGNQSIDVPSSNMNVIVTSAGPTGIVFAPPETRTWKLYTRIDGTGAFTKRGVGHLLVDRRQMYRAYTADPVTLANEGAIRVEGGTMKIVNGALTNVAGRAYCFANGATLDLDDLTIENPVLSGDGELLNATLADPTVSVTVTSSGTVSDTPTLDFASVTGRCRIDFGRTADDPIPAHTPFVVAHWTGTKPSAALFRARNAGRGLKVTFVVNDNGTVTATAAPSGLVLIVK